MNRLLNWAYGVFRFGGRALGESAGTQINSPGASIIEHSRNLGPDGAMQIAAVWRCVEILSGIVATLPLFVYRNLPKGMRELARDEELYIVLHETPNARMTKFEFWSAMMLNLLLRGNAYARLERSSNGSVYSMYPMPADQVDMQILEDGTVYYRYRINNDILILAEENVLHIKGMGNGNMGLSRLDYMRSTTTEAANAANAATKQFTNNGKPTGVLMIDSVLKKEQREKLKENFSELELGSDSRIKVLEANMKYQQLSITPEDMQLLETRQFTKQEIGTWFGVPSVLINQTEGTTTLGSSSGEIIESFYKLTIAPMLTNIEQAIKKRVFTSAQRARFIAEHNFEALLRATLKDRMDIYAKGSQNGIYTRNECRQLENMSPVEGGDELTAQTNLAPLHMLGKIKTTGGSANADTQGNTAQ